MEQNIIFLAINSQLNMSNMKLIRIRLYKPPECQVFIIVLQDISKKQQRMSAFKVINFQIQSPV